MRKIILLGMLAVVAMVALIACVNEAQNVASEAQDAQSESIQRATNQFPAPQLTNFSTRATLAKWADRQDISGGLYYTYIFADTGNLVGYFTTQGRPISGCASMTPPDQRVTGSDGAVSLTAPALDGVYYGSGGGCNSQIMFDSATDALIETVGFKTITTDQPLAIVAEPILVEIADSP